MDFGKLASIRSPRNYARRRDISGFRTWICSCGLLSAILCSGSKTKGSFNTWNVRWFSGRIVPWTTASLGPHAPWETSAFLISTYIEQRSNPGVSQRFRRPSFVAPQPAQLSPPEMAAALEKLPRLIGGVGRRSQPRSSRAPAALLQVWIL